MKSTHYIYKTKERRRDYVKKNGELEKSYLF